MEYKKLIDYLPPFLAEYREYQQIMAIEQMEFDKILARIELLLENQFIATCDEEAVVRYERMYGIIPIAGSNLEERKFNLLAKLNSELPYTYKKLEEMLKNLCGENGFILNVDANQYLVQVKVEIEAKNNVTAVERMLQNTLPANMLYKVSLLYNQYSALAEYTHAQLSAYTHKELREEVLT